MKADEIDGKTVLSQKPVAKEKYDLATRILNNLPQEIEQTGDRGIKLGDVKNGKAPSVPSKAGHLQNSARKMRTYKHKEVNYERKKF